MEKLMENIASRKKIEVIKRYNRRCKYNTQIKTSEN